MTQVLRISPNRAAVVTMEMQRGVIGDVSSIPDLAAAVADEGVIPKTATLLDAARSVGVSVVHCLAGFRGDRAGTPLNAPIVRRLLRDPNHLLIGSPAVELVPELGPEPSDLTSMRMHGVSPFGGTDLDGLLRNMQVHTLVVAGVSVNVGIPGLVIEAVNLGYEVVIARDAVTGVGSEYVEDVFANTLRLIASLATVDEIVTAWGG
jgi:nicotinamidase-related amidase